MALTKPSIKLLRTVAIFLVILQVSCKVKNQKENDKDGILPTSIYFKSSKLLDSLAAVVLDSVKCNDCINEAYIDKVTVWETYITFRVTTFNPKYHNEYLEKQNPLFYFIKNGQKIFVITGAEKYIAGDQGETRKLIFSEKNRTKTEFEIIIKFKIFDNSVSMQLVAGGPFMPEFDQNVPNFDSIEKFDPLKDYSH